MLLGPARPLGGLRECAGVLGQGGCPRRTRSHSSCCTVQEMPCGFGVQSVAEVICTA